MRLNICKFCAEFLTELDDNRELLNTWITLAFNSNKEGYVYFRALNSTFTEDKIQMLEDFGFIVSTECLRYDDLQVKLLGFDQDCNGSPYICSCIDRHSIAVTDDD